MVASSSTTHSLAHATTSRGQQSPTGLPVLTPKTPPPGPNHLRGPTTDSSPRPCAAARTTPGPLLPSAPLCYCRLRARCHLQGAQPFEADGDSPTLRGHSAHWPSQGTPRLPPRRGCSPGHTAGPRRHSRCPTGTLSLSQEKWPPAMGPSWPPGPPSQTQHLPLVTSPACRYTSTQPCGWNAAPSAARRSDTQRACETRTRQSHATAHAHCDEPEDLPATTHHASTAPKTQAARRQHRHLWQASAAWHLPQHSRRAHGGRPPTERG